MQSPKAINGKSDFTNLELLAAWVYAWIFCPSGLAKQLHRGQGAVSEVEQCLVFPVVP
jgi:hypothetical protein